MSVCGKWCVLQHMHLQQQLCHHAASSKLLRRLWNNQQRFVNFVSTIAHFNRNHKLLAWQFHQLEIAQLVVFKVSRHSDSCVVTLPVANALQEHALELVLVHDPVIDIGPPLPRCICSIKYRLKSETVTATLPYRLQYHEVSRVQCCWTILSLRPGD